MDKVQNFKSSISGNLIKIIAERKNFFHLETSSILFILDAFYFLKSRLFCEAMGRIWLFAGFSSKPQNGFFKQKLIWESSLLLGAAVPRAEA